MVKFPSNLAAYPGVAKAIMSTEDARELIINTASPILLAGKMYELRAKPVGAGCQHVWLEEARKCSPQ